MTHPVPDSERDQLLRDMNAALLASSVRQHELTTRLNAALASITDAFITLDTEFRFTQVNDYAARLCGKPAEALVGTPVWEAACFAPDTCLAAALRQAVELRGPVTREALLGPDGPWLELRAYPSVVGLTIVLHDITDRRNKEEQLRLLEASVSKVNDLVIIAEAPSQRIVFVNDAFVARTGYSRIDAYGRTPRMLQGRRTKRTTLDHIHAALEQNSPVQAEVLNYTKSGEEYWIDLQITPVTDQAGAVTHFVAVQRDATERKMAQAALERQAALLDQVQDAIILRDLSGRIRYWNGGAERLYGWTAAEAIGHLSQELILGEPEKTEEVTRSLLSQDRWAGPLNKLNKHGRAIIVESVQTLIRDEDGAPQAVLSVSTDITQQRQIEQRMQQSQRLEAVGQLTGGIAHDFNNLLTVIVGNAEVLTESLGTAEPLHQIAEMVLTAAERAAALTSQLLAFSRRQTLSPRTVDVNLLLEKLGAMLRRTLGEQIDISLASAAGLWQARIDPLQLENAVMNLCINSRDAMPAGGRITIETANVQLGDDCVLTGSEVLPGRYVMIAVSDTGCGMSAETVAKAFEPYFTTKEVGQGSGLGLSMVFGFMKQSAGHVTLHSEPGMGTVVKMYLPSETLKTSNASETPGVSKLTRGAQERVLVVEDDAMVRELVATQLQQLGYQVFEAADGPSALQALEGEGRFDLLFTDYIMPGGMNGMELAAAARRLRPGLRILLSSGYTEGSGLRSRLETGTLLLTKPYRRQALADMVRAALTSA